MGTWAEKKIPQHDGKRWREKKKKGKKVTAFIVRWGLWRGWKGERMEREREGAQLG